mgnify:CR=1 FL=1
MAYVMVDVEADGPIPGRYSMISLGAVLAREPLDVTFYAELMPGSPGFVSDNAGFDWQFVNWYFHRFLGDNPFGHHSYDLGSLFQGAVRNLHASFRHLRETPHTHNALDDAVGNAQAFLSMVRDHGIRL